MPDAQLERQLAQAFPIHGLDSEARDRLVALAEALSGIQAASEGRANYLDGIADALEWLGTGRMPAFGNVFAQLVILAAKQLQD